MTFDAILAQVLDLLQHQGRTAYRALKVRFNLDDDYLEHTGAEEPVYVFKHVLTQEVAYGSLLHERRRVLHIRIVEAIETLYADRLAEQVERLARHAFWGEVWDKAAAYYWPEQRRLHARLSEKRWCVSSRRWLP